MEESPFNKLYATIIVGRFTWAERVLLRDTAGICDLSKKLEKKKRQTSEREVQFPWESISLAIGQGHLTSRTFAVAPKKMICKNLLDKKINLQYRHWELVALFFLKMFTTKESLTFHSSLSKFKAKNLGIQKAF